MKYIFIVCAGVVLFAAWQHQELQALKQQKTELEQQNRILRQNSENLTKQMEIYNEKQMEAGRQIAALKEAALAAPDNCYNRRLDAAVLAVVRNRKNSDN